MGKNDFELIDSVLNEYGSNKDELYVLMELKSFNWLSINDFWNCMRREVTFPKSMIKIAILINAKWLDKTSILIDIITPFKIKTFPSNAHNLAIDWLDKSLSCEQKVVKKLKT